MLMFLGIILKNCAFFSDSELMELLQQDHAQACHTTKKPFKSEAIIHSA